MTSAPPRRFEPPRRRRGSCKALRLEWTPSLFASLLVGFAAFSPAVPAAAQYLDETREMVWSDPEEPELLVKAAELQSAAAIYEYVRNEFVFASYDGARSNATSTFLSRRGNDVDVASVLIAMLRSQGVAARYAEGLASFDESDATSWLEIPHPTRAVDYLQRTGYQDTSLADGRLAFRHTWVQALVPLESYRGAGSAAAVDCALEPARCTWVDLDPSFKLHRFRDPAELVDVSDAVPFDYEAYYHADDPDYPTPADGLDRSGKGPLEIYEEQILHYLHTTPGLEGKTLDEVVYEGEVVPEEHGILPISLPFRVDPSAVATYASVEEHDAAPGTFRWAKRVRFEVTFPSYFPLSSLTLSGGDPVPLVELSAQNLTFAYESTDFDDPAVPKQLVARLGGAVHQVLFTLTDDKYTSNGGNGKISEDLPDVGTPIEVRLIIESTGAAIEEATYPNLTLGGSYLVATGGAYSSFSQVRRSSRRLLEAVETNPVLPNEAEGGLLYVDANGNGSIDAGEVPLLEDAATQNLLTGGVLAVAKDLYFARVRDALERVGDLQRSTLPPASFLGLVSSVHDVRSVDGTAFQVIPVGLLVDMKAVSVAPPFKIATDAPNEGIFRLAGHILSALEHEIWEELTGFEAISTMKGIGKSLADGATLMFLDETETQTPVATALANWELQPGLPAGYDADTLELFGHNLWLPRRTDGDPEKQLDVVRATVGRGWELRDLDEIRMIFESWTQIRDDLEALAAEPVSTFTFSPGGQLVQPQPEAQPGTWTTGGFCPICSPPTWTTGGLSGPREQLKLRFGNAPNYIAVRRFQIFWEYSITTCGVFFCSGGVSYLVFRLDGFDDFSLSFSHPPYLGDFFLAIPTFESGTDWIGVSPGLDTRSLRKTSLLAEISDPISFQPVGDFEDVTLDSVSMEVEYIPGIAPYQAGSDPACVESGDPQAVLDNLETCFLAVIGQAGNEFVHDYFFYFDDFDPAKHLFRDNDPGRHVPAEAIANIRNELVLGADSDGDGTPDADARVEFVVPTTVADGELLDFAVWIQRYFDDEGTEFSSNYIINPVR